MRDLPAGWLDGRCATCHADRAYDRHGVPLVRPAARPACTGCEAWLANQLAATVAEDGGL